MLALALIAAGLPAGMGLGAAMALAGSEPAAASFFSYDGDTGGAWNGKYGADGYILFGYGAQPGEGEPSYVDFYVHDVYKKPAYLEPVTILDGNGGGAVVGEFLYAANSGYSAPGGNVARTGVWPGARDGDASVLDLPASAPDYGNPAQKAQAGITWGEGSDSGHAGSKRLTFRLSGADERHFTVYTNRNSYDRYFGIKSLGGEDLVPLQKPRDAWRTEDFRDAAYITFAVRGGFTLYYEGDWTSDPLCGVFFDTPETTPPDPPEPTPPPAQGGSEAVYLGSDSGTKGDWQGKYGAGGYILVGYGDSVEPLKNSWSSDTPSIPENDRAALPAYVSGYEYGPGGRIVLPPIDDGYASGNLAAAPPPDFGLPRRAAFAQSDGRWKASFALGDDEEHIFSIYAIGRVSANDATVVIADPDGGGELAAKYHSTDEFAGSMYMSFLVRGSFRVETGLASDYFCPSAFFFDEPAAQKPQGLAAEAAAGRSVELSWENAGAADRIIVEKSEDGARFAQRAVLAGDAEFFADEGLQPGREYRYRLRYGIGTMYGEATAAVSQAIAPMEATALSLLEPSAPLSARLGDTVALGARLALASDGSPLAGKTVRFKLIGPNTGDGATLGQEIPAVVASALTDAGGVAEAEFTVAYAGQFGLAAYTEPDDGDGLDGAESEAASLSASAPPDASPPAIFKLSDAVRPGGYFTLNGHGLGGDALKVMIARSEGGDLPPAPTAGAFEAPIVQRGSGGYFVVAQLPPQAEAGAYDVWASNENGFGECRRLNAARPLFLSEKSIAPGFAVSVAGRNFDPAEFGAGGAAPAVRLRAAPGGSGGGGEPGAGGAGGGSGKPGGSGGATGGEQGAVYAAEVAGFGPYKISFAVGEGVPQGEYAVEVSNDGASWAAVASGQTLSVEAAGEDPLGLGASWAADFGWGNRFDVTDYGAIPDDGGDDTAQAQAAVDAAAQAEGGGVAYFPDGAYRIDTITLPSGVVLLGESQAGTKLVYTGSGGVNLINSLDAAVAENTAVMERQGVARMTMLLDDPGARPDSFMWLGQGWKGAFEDKSRRTANRLFAIDVTIDYPTDSDRASGGRGIGLEFIGRERVIVKGCSFTGYHAQPFITGMSEYYTLEGNYFEFTLGYVVSLSTYFFAEGNHIRAVHPELNEESHGIFGRSSAYMAENTVENTGAADNSYNDGEPLAVEVPNGYFNYGRVLAATPLSVTVAPRKALAWPTMDYGELSVAITNGRGMGQLRKVASISGYVIAVDRPFDVAPDATSAFTLIAPNENATICNNTVINNAKGIWLFGNSFDGLVAGNRSIDSEGIFIWSNRGPDGTVPDYYTRIAGNELTGASRRTGQSGIGYNTGRSDGSAAFSVDVYSTEILGNSIAGPAGGSAAGGDTEAPELSGIYCASASYASGYDGDPSFADSMNTIIGGNTLSGLKTGVTLTHSISGQIVAGNRYSETVEAFIADTGSMSTLLAGNERIPPAPPGEAPAIAAGVRAEDGLRELISEDAGESGAIAAFEIAGEGIRNAGTINLRLSFDSGAIASHELALPAPVAAQAFIREVAVEDPAAPGVTTVSVYILAHRGQALSVADGEPLLTVALALRENRDADVELSLGRFDAVCYPSGEFEGGAADVAATVSPASATAAIRFRSRFDVNLDGAVTLRDVDAVRYHLGLAAGGDGENGGGGGNGVDDENGESGGGGASWPSALAGRCDLNGDGAIGIEDLTLVIAKYESAA
jgi:hypothetical protein